jgi:hypothetical protein
MFLEGLYSLSATGTIEEELGGWKVDGTVAIEGALPVSFSGVFRKLNNTKLGRTSPKESGMDKR